MLTALQVMGPPLNEAGKRLGRARDWGRPIGNGLLVGLTGYVSTVSLVISALVATGAQARQVVSALFVLGLCMGLPALILSYRYRSPISVGWSTTGAALLVAHGPVHGGLPMASGAFLIAGLLTLLVGMWKPLAKMVGAVPACVANAMLAGLLVSLCMVPLQEMVRAPWFVAPIVGAWLIAQRLARPWAVPAAALAALVMASHAGWPWSAVTAWQLPELKALRPSIEGSAVTGLALPLFVVTMLSQNAPAFSVLQDHGFRTHPEPVLLCTGMASMAGAPFGSLGVGLATVTAAMCAGSNSGPEPARRWIAASVAGLCQIALGTVSGVVAPWVLSLPAAMVGTVAGLAVLGTCVAALRRSASERTAPWAAAITFLVTCTGGALLGVSIPVWAVIAGLLCHRYELRIACARRRRLD